MNDELSDDVKEKFMLPLTIELQDHKEKLFYNAPVSPISRLQRAKTLGHHRPC